uniref:OSJNBb0032D24.15 protein n=1 Tax=Oryza sativa subsp. japonica TaxID=39947 RepID=Q7XNH8_ORYSJ|nr:OSJNBb0032D24.15 [Oryza sativa Japonica Group]
MLRAGARPDGYTLPLLNRAAASLPASRGEAELVGAAHAVGVRAEFAANVYFCNTLVDAYARRGDGRVRQEAVRRNAHARRGFLDVAGLFACRCLGRPGGVPGVVLHAAGRLPAKRRDSRRGAPRVHGQIERRRRGAAALLRGEDLDALVQDGSLGRRGGAVPAVSEKRCNFLEHYDLRVFFGREHFQSCRNVSKDEKRGGKATHGYMIRNNYEAQSEKSALVTSIIKLYARLLAVGALIWHEGALTASIRKILLPGVQLLKHTRSMAMVWRLWKSGIVPHDARRRRKAKWGDFPELVVSITFGITPELGHHTCMVDVLGRSGNLDDALQVISDMNVKPDGRIWGALLASCRTYSNSKLASYVAQKLMKLEPGCEIEVSIDGPCSQCTVLWSRSPRDRRCQWGLFVAGRVQLLARGSNRSDWMGCEYLALLAVKFSVLSDFRIYKFQVAYK